MRRLRADVGLSGVELWFRTESDFPQAMRFQRPLDIAGLVGDLGHQRGVTPVAAPRLEAGEIQNLDGGRLRLADVVARRDNAVSNRLTLSNEAGS